jgi:plasmid stability protein
MPAPGGARLADSKISGEEQRPVDARHASSIARKPDFWYYGEMKTTLDLPDDLMRAVKIRAAEQNRKLKDLIADLLQRGLAQEAGAPTVRHRVRLPLVQCAHDARPDEEMTPERVAAVLLEEEAGGSRVALR